MVAYRCAVCSGVYDRDEQSDAYVIIDDEDGREEYTLHRGCARDVVEEWYTPREGLGEYPDELGHSPCEGCGESVGLDDGGYYPDSSGVWLCEGCLPEGVPCQRDAV